MYIVCEVKRKQCAGKTKFLTCVFPQAVLLEF